MGKWWITRQPGTGCAAAAHTGDSWKVSRCGRMENATVCGHQRAPDGAGQTTRSILRHNHGVVVASIPPIPGVAPGTAQPRAL